MLTNGRMISILTRIIMEFVEHDEYTTIKTSIGGEHEVMDSFDEVCKIIDGYDNRFWSSQN